MHGNLCPMTRSKCDLPWKNISTSFFPSISTSLEHKWNFKIIHWILKEVATHSSTLVWKIPWTEGHGRLQSMGSRRVGHDWATSLHVTTLFFSLSLCHPPMPLNRAILKIKDILPTYYIVFWDTSYTLEFYYCDDLVIIRNFVLHSERKLDFSCNWKSFTLLIIQGNDRNYMLL